MTKPAQNPYRHLGEAVGKCTQILWSILLLSQTDNWSVLRFVSRKQESLAGGGGKSGADKVFSLTTLSPSSPRQRERWDHTVHEETIEDSAFLKSDIVTVTSVAVDSFLLSWFIFKILVCIGVHCLLISCETINMTTETMSQAVIRELIFTDC